MSDILKRLRASLNCDAINGDSFERSICMSQMKEAIIEIESLRAQVSSLEERLREAEKSIMTLKEWLDNNTSFYDVDADYKIEGHNIPVLVQVSKRIWYHATYDITSYPFSSVINAAMKDKP